MGLLVEQCFGLLLPEHSQIFVRWQQCPDLARGRLGPLVGTGHSASFSFCAHNSVDMMDRVHLSMINMKVTPKEQVSYPQVFLVKS